MGTITTKDNYWISPNAVGIILNALGDNDRIQCSVSSGAAILCYVRGVSADQTGDGLEFDNGHQYKHWPLTIIPTYFNDHREKYLYVAIPRKASFGSQAMFVYPSEVLDVYGCNENGVQVGDVNYYYIWTQGIISSSGDDGQTKRTWLQNPEWGWLDSNEQWDSEGEGSWWEWLMNGTVRFIKNIAYAFFEQLEAQWASIYDLYVTNELHGAKGYFKTVQSTNFQSGLLDGTGWRITEENEDRSGSELEVDFLKVRKKATFMELEVRKETFVGGNQNYSPAGSTIYRVDYMTEDNKPLNWMEITVPFTLYRYEHLGDDYSYSGKKMVPIEMDEAQWPNVHHFRCYLLADNGTTATRNWWRVGDQVRCQAFNKAESVENKRYWASEDRFDAQKIAEETGVPAYTVEDPSTPKPIETTYYWRLCSNIGSEILEDGNAYDYIDLYCERWSGWTEAEKDSFRARGSGIPDAGDQIVCMGNRYDQDRMNMISIQTTGDDNNPPAMKGYRGIHTFDLNKANKVFEISPEQILFRSNKFKFLMDDGDVLPPVIDRGEWAPNTRYHYYDRVSYFGSMWLCVVVDDYQWEDANGNVYSGGEVTQEVVGEGEFEYRVDGVVCGTDHYYKTGKVGARDVYYIRYYTYSEPADDNIVWLKQVSKGTEITDNRISYAASLDGNNHPDDEEEYSGGAFDPSGITVPDNIKQKTDSLLASFSSQVTVAKNSKTYEYLTRIVHEAYLQYNGGTSPYGLPALYTKANFPSLIDYYGSQSDPTKAFDAMAGFCVGTVLTELCPSKRNALLETAYNIGPDKNTFIYYYRFESDQNIARLVGSAVCAAMRGRLRPDMAAMRTEVGGSLLTTSIEEASAEYAAYKDKYYVNLFNFMPSAPGPYYKGTDADYTDRSVPGIPYDAYDLADHNLQKDLDIYNLVVSDYNLNGSHHQEVVQAIADKELDAHHLFGPNRESGGYSFHPIFGQDTIGRYINAEGTTAGVIGYITDVGIASRQALKQGAWDGRYRPGEAEGSRTSKPAPYGVLYNYTIDNIDGHPVSGYDEAGYNRSQTDAVNPNSYPSGHSSGIWATALYLIELMPARAAAIMKAANQVAVSRQITRYHWNSDTIVGRLAGATIAPVMRASSDYAAMLDASRTEISGGEWKATIEETGIKMGQYLWTRRKDYYSDNRIPTVEYTVARWGIDGDGISEIDSFYYAQKDEIADMAAYEKTHTVHWYDTFAECAAANGGVGKMQGWQVWEKTIIKYDAYDKDTGEPITRPDVIQYSSSRIGQDGWIGMEEYYMLSDKNDFTTLFGDPTKPATYYYAKTGIRWYTENTPAADLPSAEKWRLADVQYPINLNMWSPTMPTYDKATHGSRIYLWNFELSVDGSGTQYATKPVCIGNHARGIKGVRELYAVSESGFAPAGRDYPSDIRTGTPQEQASDKHIWTDEKYDRAPEEHLPYQWNWTRTLYSAPKDGNDTLRDQETGYYYEDQFHVSAVMGTKGEDGAGSEFIYCRTKTATAPKGYDGTVGKAGGQNISGKETIDGVQYDKCRTVDDFVPNPTTEGGVTYTWTDNPLGISEEYPYEWQCERKSTAYKTNGGFSGGHLWSAFSAPTEWSKWGYNGRDGDGTEYVFIRTKTNTPPVIAANDGGTASQYQSQEWRPYVTPSADIEPNDSKTESGKVYPRCTDDPKGTDDTYKFEWVAKRTMTAAATSGSNQGQRVWKSYYECIGSPYKMSLWSNQAQNSVRLALDNEHEDFLYSASQADPIAPSGGATSQAHLYDGPTAINPANVKWQVSCNGGTSFVDASDSFTDGTVAKAKISAGGLLTVAGIKVNAAKVIVKAVYPKTNGNEYRAEFTANKTNQDKYDLKIVPNAIAFNESEEWKNKTITPSAVRTDLQGNITDVTINTTEADGLRLYYSYVKDDGTLYTPDLNLLTTATFSLTKKFATSCIGVYFELRLYTGTSFRMCDYETVEIAKSANGTGINVSRLDISNEMDTIPTDSTGKISAKRKVETVVNLYNGASEVNISTVDFAGRISGGPATSGSGKIADFSQAASGNGKKLSWEFAAGKTMADAYNITISYTYDDVTYTAVFTITASKGQAIYQLKPSHSSLPCTVKSDNTYNNPPALTLTVLKIDGDSTDNITEFSDTGTIESGTIYVRYSKSSMPTDKAKGYAWPQVNSVQATSDDENVYIAMFNSSDKLLDRETIPVIKDGKKGDASTVPGPQGKYEEVQYARSSSYTSYADQYIDGGASGWKTTAPLPSVYYPVIWKRSRLYDPATSTYGNWSYVRETGEKGADGVDGKDGSPGRVGLWYRYAGVWNVDVSSVTNTDTVGYYVKYGNNFYMNIKESGKANTTTPSDSSDVWEVMNSSFEYFITKAMFADTAYLGSFIINGDWMISQSGVMYGTDGSEHTIDPSTSWSFPGGSYTIYNSYEKFDPSYPNTSKSGSVNFAPAYAVDGKTGKAYLNNLYAKGSLTVTNGNNSITIDSDGIVGIWGNDGIKLNYEGLQRRLPNGSWVNMFAQRYAKVVTSDYECQKYDDYVLAGQNYINIVLPTLLTSGRQITVRNVGTGRESYILSQLPFVTGGGPDVDTTTYGGKTYNRVKLYNDDRAELVYYDSKWYWNAYGT